MSESIYNLVPREYVPPPPKVRVYSTKDPRESLTGSTLGTQGTTRLPGAAVIKKKDGALFGPPKNEYQHLTRSIKETCESTAAPREKIIMKAPIVKRDEKPVMGIRSEKNFIVANAVEAILQVPKPVEDDGPKFLTKEDYGKVPAYLTQVKEEVRRENEMIASFVRRQMGEEERLPEESEELSEGERLDLLDSLKHKWEVVNSEYQKITHLVKLDTTGKVRRKEQLENELQTLENYIDKLSRNGPIVIRK